jgi:6-phosphogluconolactonase (cycloisomerase 2 family)
MKILVVFVGLCTLSACGGGAGSGPPGGRGILTSIAVNPSSQDVAAGLTQQFSATGTYDDGTSRALTNVSWSSSDGSIVTINNSGLATTHKQGNATITATASSVIGNAALTVGPAVLQGYSLYPPAANVPLGTTQKFSVLAQYSDGTTSDVSSNYTWQLSDPTVGSVDAAGNMTSNAVKYARLIATLQGPAQARAQTASLPTVATADVAGVYYPRFAFVNFLASRYVEKLSIDGGSGQLRYYQRFLTNNYNTAFGCMSADPTNQFLYLTEPSANLANGPDKYSLFETDALTGELSEVPGSPFQVSGGFGCLRFDPTGEFAFATVVVSPGSPAFVAFTRDVNTGILTQLSSIALSDPASEIALAPSGQFLYFSTYHATSLPPSAQAFGYSIDPVSGAVTPIPGTPFAMSGASGTFSMHPSGTLLFMSNTNGSSIDVYSIDSSTGALTALSSKSISTCVNPSALTFSAHGQIAYFTCSSGSLNTLQVADDGTMSIIASTPLAGLSSSFALDPTGKYLYVLGFQPRIETFQIDATGIPQLVSTINGLTMAGNVFVLGGNSPTVYATSTAYITSAGDSHLTTYAVQADGTFNTTPVSVLATQSGPHSLSTTPGSTQMMAASSATHPNVSFYDLDPLTGAPSGPALYGIPDISGTVLLDITRQFAFETDPVGGAVYTFGRFNGQWSDVVYQINGIPAGAGAGPMVNDPSGQLLYVGNSVAHTISAYRYYDPQPEEQTVQFTSPYPDGSPYITNAAPISLGVDMSAKTLCAIFDDGTLRSYQIDMFSNGHIAQAASVNLNGIPQALAVQPNSERVYVVTSAGITGFSIDPNAGTLSPINSATIAMADMNGIHVEPSGNFLYVTTSPQGSTGGVYGYSIAPDGSLATLGTAPLVLSMQPTSMAFKSLVQ